MTKPRDFSDILSKLPDALQSGEQWTASCPIPGHATPKGHLGLKDGGDKALVSCHGGRHDFKNNPADYQDLCELIGFETLTYGNDRSPRNKKIQATYNYTDPDGKLLYQVIRYAPKTFTQRRPDGHDGWIEGSGCMEGVKRVIYRWPEVTAAIKAGRTVYIVEGEKDADAITKLGLTATTNSGGAGKWKSDLALPLTNAEVVIIPDKDPPGKAHAQAVAISLHGKVKAIRLLELPNLDGHKVHDASDWINAGGTREELERLTTQAPEYRPGGPVDWHDYAIEHDALLAKDLPPLDYLVDGIIVTPGLGVLAAPKKRGKSWMALQLAQCTAAGDQFLGKDTKQGPVIHLALEDGERRLKQRLEMQQTVKGLPITYVTRFQPLNSDAGFAELRGLVQEKHPALIVIDTLASAKDQHLDENEAGATGDLFNQLHDLAITENTFILLIAHHGKASRGDAGFDIRGSSAISGATDINIGLYKNSDETYDLKAEGRDIGELDLRINFDAEITWCWHCQGDARDLRRAQAEDQIIEAVATLGGGVDASAIATELGIHRVNVQRHLPRLREQNLLHYETVKATKGTKILYYPPITNRTPITNTHTITNRTPYQQGESVIVCNDLVMGQGPEKSEADQLGAVRAVQFVMGSGDNPQNDLVTATPGGAETVSTVSTVSTMGDPWVDYDHRDLKGLSACQVIEIWRAEGSPVIEIGPGRSIEDLARCLNHSAPYQAQLDAITEWLTSTLEQKRRHI